MIRRIKLPGWIVIIFLLSGITLGINQVVAMVWDNSSEQDKIIEKHVDSSVYPGLNIKTTTKETNLYTLSISRPYTENGQINQSINKWIDKEKTEFTSNIEELEDMLKKSDFRAHLNIEVETKQIADRLYTLDFKAYQITGGANGITKMKSFIIDLNQNKQLELEDIFQIDDQTTADIQKLIVEELDNKQEISLYLFDEMINDAIKDPNEWKWSINRDHAIFYFDQYEIAAGAAGPIKVKIPIEKIKPYLKVEFAELIDIELPEKEEKEQEDHSEDWAKLDPDGKYIALTFDDGPHPEVTPRILKTLKEHDAKATFFMLGSQVKYYPKLANKVKKAGHEIASHTMSHKDLTVLGFDNIQNEIQEANQTIEKATGNVPILLRPPYGASNSDVEQIALDSESSLVMWSVDSLDWKSRNASAVIKEVMSHVSSESIVLMHDIHPSTADALPQLLSSLEEQGYQMVTVSQLLELWDDKGVGPYYGK